MKKNILILLSLFSILGASAQDITDALRYSSEDLKGTARFRAMSGAFGALGGDLSAVAINPASSAVFNKSFGTVTFDFSNSKNTVNYFNGSTSTEDDEFNLNQAGGVFVFTGTNNSPWQKFSLAVNYTDTKDFEDSFIAIGTSNSSIDEYFLEYANGVPLDLLETIDGENVNELYAYLGANEGFGVQQAFLGYQSYIIDPISTDLTNTSYISSIAAGSFDQEYARASTGLNGKFSFNFGAQYEENLYLGINLNTHFLNYDSSTRFFERNTNSNSTTNEVFFSNNLSTNGDGFSLQLGTIAKLNESFRIGATYESPTWYSISEETTQYIETYSDEFDDTVIVDPRVVNIYPDYNLKTPGKISGSLAYLIGKEGLISFDYSYKDYSNIEFRPKNDLAFEYQNELIEELLKPASTYRFGGEYRFDRLSLRAGYRFEESPYEDETTRGDLTGYSAGLGYSFGSFKVDFAYTNTSFDENRSLYQVGLTNTANINRDLSSFIVSLSFGL